MRHFRVPQFRLTTAAMFLVMMSLAASTTKADDKNEVIKHWAKFKPGTTVTMAANITAGTYTVAMKKTDTLVEVTKEHVILETAVTTEFGGHEQTSPPTRTTIDSTSNQGELKEVGKESIEAGGKTYECRVMEGKATTTVPQRGGGTAKPANDAQARMWINDDVPGGVVQIKVNTAGREVVFKLVSFEAK